MSSVSFGIFGVMAYVLPFLLFGAVAFGISNKGNAHAYIKIVSGILLLLVLCAFFQLVMHPFQPKDSILSYYQYASDYRKAGGLIGGCLAKLLCPLLGVVGTYVILIVLGVICVILITEKSLLAPLGRGKQESICGYETQTGRSFCPPCKTAGRA